MTDDYGHLENEWRNLVKTSDKDLTKIFPEAKPIVYYNLRCFKRIKNYYLRKLAVQIKVMRQSMTPIDYEIIGRALLKHLNPNYRAVQTLNRRISRLSGFAYYFNPEPNQKIPFRELIDRAKAVSIEDVATPYLRKIRRYGNRISALCPFHNERTPSLSLYRSTNSFHCYGCGEHGSVVDFVMKTQNLNFKEAVDYLVNNH